MNKTIAITAIALVSTIMGMSAISPAIGFDPVEYESGAPLYLQKGVPCTPSDICTVIVDADKNGCDADDTVIKMPYKATQRAAIQRCS